MEIISSPSWSSRLKYHQYPSIEIPIQTPCGFPRIFPSSLSEYPLKNSHPNTRGNFVLSSYESLRMIPRIPLYFSPWKSFSRCGEFFSNPNSKPFKHKLENLFPSLFSPLTPWPGPALPLFPIFLFSCTGPASCRSPTEPPSPCPVGPLPWPWPCFSQAQSAPHAPPEPKAERAATPLPCRHLSPAASLRARNAKPRALGSLCTPA